MDAGLRQADRASSKLLNFAPMSLLSTFAVMLTQVLKTLAKTVFVVDLDSSKATSRGGIFLLAFVVARKLPFCAASPSLPVHSLLLICTPTRCARKCLVFPRLRRVQRVRKQVDFNAWLCFC